MVDPRFFATSGPFTLAELAARAEAALAPGADPALTLTDVAPLAAAGPGEISFLDNKRYVAALAGCRAGACILHPSMVAKAPAGMALLLHEKPYLGYARIAAAFHPLPPATPGIHPSAVIAPGAKIGHGCEIGPFVVVEAGAEIGANCRIAAHAVIGRGVAIGPDCRIGPHASISHAILGARVMIYPGVRIGQEGFGFAEGPAGFVSVPQLGRVLVGDDVEVGANTTIDRGSASDTVIGAGSRIDNLVQIGHNVRIGRCCVIVAQVGISGSTELGDFVMAGGQAGFTGHLKVGARARIAAKAGVAGDVEPGQDVAGGPARPAAEHWRATALLYRLAREERERRAQAVAGAAQGRPKKKAD
ncbi:MAG: UDP-3-O-(3-hydroxymyristoyl)glucosamine N-acyltransferase [Alphaproteobacteria bacterium]|nr:UDP-3-O-(3-hydroxymyristoyl)glucosamine N-acyltransferase [Alphaproteobacteria bacterium]